MQVSSNVHSTTSLLHIASGEMRVASSILYKLFEFFFAAGDTFFLHHVAHMFSHLFAGTWREQQSSCSTYNSTAQHYQHTVQSFHPCIKLGLKIAGSTGITSCSKIKFEPISALNNFEDIGVLCRGFLQETISALWREGSRVCPLSDRQCALPRSLSLPAIVVCCPWRSRW